MTLFSLLLLLLFVLPNVTATPVKDTGHEQVYCWYDDLYLDRDKNRIDDQIDSYIQEPRGSKLQAYVDKGYLNPNDIPVFVVYKHRPQESDIVALEALGNNIEIKFISQYLDVVISNNLTTAQVQAASNLPGVIIVEFQKIYVPTLSTSVKAITARESDDYSPQTAWEYDGGYTGEGVVVAVLDTGVDDEHDSLDGKFIAGVDFQDSSDDKDGTNNPDDKDGHGTHCAATIMGTGGTQGTNMGVAPDAKLVDIKVLSDWGIGGNLYEGIEWCISKQDTFGIDVLSISIGELIGGNSDGKDSNGKIAQQACDNGMIVVAAIGNDGNEHVGISSPAAADNVIAVGALNEQDTVDRADDWISDFSNSGPRKDDGDSDDYDELKPDVTAPGEGINSANSYNGNLAILGAAGYKSLSGTSMACPHVAGVCAIIREASPDLEPDEVQDIIRDSAEPRGDQYNPSYGNYSVLFGWGMLDAYNAVRMATGDYQRVTIESPAAGSLVHGSIDISGKAENQKGTIVEVNVKVDDGNWDVASGTTYWSYSLDTTQYTNGAHTVYVRSQNDNYAYSDEVPLGISINNLGVTITFPTSGSTVKGEITLTGECDGVNIETVEIKIGDDSYSTVLNTGLEADWDTWSYTWDSTDVDDGEYTITVRAKAGDQMPTTSITVDVDNDKGSGGGGDDSPGFQLIPLILLTLAFVLLITLKRRFKRKKQR